MLYKFGVTIDNELFVVKYSDRKHVYVTNCTSQRDVDSLIMIAYMIDDSSCCIFRFVVRGDSALRSVFGIL